MQPIQTKGDKAQTRRDQIISAAITCFRRSGFHGAGMAEIARHAELSVGQIYRYFTKKDAIIEEIVRRIVDKKIQLLMLMLEEKDPHSLMAHALTTQSLNDDLIHDDDKALTLEVTAEATRNPRVSDILQEADAKLFHQAVTLLQRRYPQCSPESIAARVEFMAVLSEGTTFRSVLPQKAPIATLTQLYQHIFQLTFPEDNYS
ncbi:TetR/AcrR family transcriptional regulator [Prodigiosinella confusarubida]|uniref:TetR/AcrR family transcriptional regulator n=1 Tax=Serratia sp. (strain ATCC 39006) TaxID=104623 RepID=A0A2I5T6Q2_SERS3|nr:TetR/AcrR family transcriptional regulator [Serratia sp. ATCC 39006]AUH00243.1 TetR/AcrR family transcriptional regulator [Serratia sp. ATCC 39006]AUH04563.1 TetR/AcrR family transcriptional regulator [Serratia sp. ATCC 39006]